MLAIKIREYKESDEKLVTRLIYRDYITEIFERLNKKIMKGRYLWIFCVAVFILSFPSSQ